jgi:hypothetical protein
MKTTMKCMMAVLVFGTLTGCEALREQAQVRGAEVLSSGDSPQTGDACVGCRRKWSAKPDGGVNGPPWGT